MGDLIGLVIFTLLLQLSNKIKKKNEVTSNKKSLNFFTTVVSLKIRLEINTLVLLVRYWIRYGTLGIDICKE